MILNTVYDSLGTFGHSFMYFFTWLYDYGLQLESLWTETGPGADRGRHPVQQLAHMLSIERHHGVQALHLAQDMDSLQSLKVKWGKILSQHL